MNRRWLVFIWSVTVFFFCVSCGTKTQVPTEALVSHEPPLHWEEKGTGEPTLVFVHGWSNNLHVWDEQIARFSKTHRVVAVDLPGFGMSSNKDGLWTMEAFGRSVSEVIRTLDLRRVILVGFSMGGPVSLETAKQSGGRVMGVVLVDVLQNPDYRYADDFIQSMTQNYMDIVTQPTPDKVKPFFRTRREELARRYMAMVKDVPKTGWKESLENCLHWMNEKAADTLQGLDIPVFSINSDEHPTEAAIFRKYSPLYKVRVIQGVNHVVFWEKPDMFETFLDEFIEDMTLLELH